MCNAVDDVAVMSALLIVELQKNIWSSLPATTPPTLRFVTRFTFASSPQRFRKTKTSESCVYETLFGLRKGESSHVDCKIPRRFVSLPVVLAYVQSPAPRCAHAASCDLLFAIIMPCTASSHLEKLRVLQHNHSTGHIRARGTA